MESYNQENEQANPQEAIFNAEKLVQGESLVLQGFEGKAGQTARAFLLISEILAKIEKEGGRPEIN